MAKIFVYADFNGLEEVSIQGFDSRVGLTGYGSLADLARQQIQLVEGVHLVVYEPEDIEADGIAYFDPACADPAGRLGQWYALLNQSGIRESQRSELPSEEHLCSACGRNIYSHLRKVGRHYNEECPYCSVSTMAPLSPPKMQPDQSFKSGCRGVPREGWRPRRGSRLAKGGAA